MLSVDVPFVVLCSLLAVAAAGTPRLHDYRPIVFEDSTTGNEEQRFFNAGAEQKNSGGGGIGGRSCCGAYPSSSSSSSSSSLSSTATATTAAAVVDDFTDVEDRTPKEIPLSVIMELNEVSNVSELFTKFMPNVDMREANRMVATTGFQSRSAALTLERKAALVPKAAGCTVELQTISLRDTDDPSLYYYPPCTRVNRCGGCCAHDLLACQPTKSETLHFEVMVSQYNGAGKLEFVGRKPVSVIQHSKCKCDCIVQAKDCNELQTYHPNDCRCMCNNEDDRDKCNEEYSLKLWNPATCTCQCRETQECTSGFGFDYNTCRCEALRTKTKITSGYDFNTNVYSLGGRQ